MNKEESNIAKVLLDDIAKMNEPKARFDAISRYELFMRAVSERIRAEKLMTEILSKE